VKYLPATWSLPLLSSLYWYACVDPTDLKVTKMPRSELDARWAACGFAASLILLIVGRQLWAFSEKSK
jgi:hypothetical protein